MKKTVKTKEINVKNKFINELKLYFTYVLFLGLFFSAFTTYQRLILGNYGITYLHYGFGWIEALILAKIILIGQSLKLGEKFSDRPLIFPTIYKTIVFTVFVLVFSILEHFIIDFISGKNIVESYYTFVTKGENQIFANIFVMLFVFILFFAFLETSRVLGKGKLYKLFLKRNNQKKKSLKNYF